MHWAIVHTHDGRLVSVESERWLQRSLSSNGGIGVCSSSVRPKRFPWRSRIYLARGPSPQPQHFCGIWSTNLNCLLEANISFQTKQTIQTSYSGIFSTYRPAIFPARIN